MAVSSLTRSLLGSSIGTTTLYSSIRCLATQTPNSQLVFNKKVRILHLDRSSLDEEAHVYDYIRGHVAKDLCDRVDDLTLKERRTILNIGSCSGLVASNMNPDRVANFIQCDISPQNIRRSKRLISMLPTKFPIDYLQSDEERITVRDNCVDLVTSCLNLHWVNDLVSCFKQVFGSLKNDSPFIGTIFGGDTLFELRSSLQLAEMERLSGFSSHVAPKTTGQDVARLLQATGFQLITVDISDLVIRHPSIFELMFDLKGMGENNASIFGSHHMHKDVLLSAASIYQQMYGSSKSIEDGVPATFQIIHFIGWKNPTKATPIKSVN